MANGDYNPTYGDILARLDSQGEISPVIELLVKMTPMLEYATLTECNRDTGHEVKVRTGMPTATHSAFSGFATGVKSDVGTVHFNIGTIKKKAELTKDLYDLGGRGAVLRADEGRVAIEGISQFIESTLLYGNENTDPRGYNGIMQYYNSINQASVESAENVVSGGGTTGSQASILLVNFESGVSTSILTAKGIVGGIQRIDRGLVDEEDGSGGSRLIYREYFNWTGGLLLPDWRRNGRLANLQVADFGGGSAPDINTKMLELYYRVMPNVTSGNTIIMAHPRVLAEWARRDREDVKAGGQLSYEKVDGRVRQYWMGLPVVANKHMLITESVLS